MFRTRRERAEALALLEVANYHLALANVVVQSLSEQAAFERQQATNAYRVARSLADMLLQQDLSAEDAASLGEWRGLLMDTVALREEHQP